MTHADFEHSAVTDAALCGFGYFGWALPGSGIPALDGMAVSAFAYCLLRFVVSRFSVLSVVKRAENVKLQAPRLARGARLVI